MKNRTLERQLKAMAIESLHNNGSPYLVGNGTSDRFWKTVRQKLGIRPWQVWRDEVNELHQRIELEKQARMKLP